jgi:uncharacterized protein involved in outer membrane biogenesis
VRAARVAGWAAVGLFALITLLVIIVLFLDLSKYREPIQAAISSAIGRQVRLGSISLKVLPHPTFVVQDVSVANPPWASRPDFAQAERIQIRLSIWPLLYGDVQVLSLNVRGLDVLLEVQPGGANNWTFGQGNGGSSTAPPVIKSLSCERCTVAYREGSRTERVTIEAAAGVLAANEPVQFLVTGTYREVVFKLSALGGTLADLLSATKPWPIDTKLRTAGATLTATGTVHKQNLNLDVTFDVEQLVMLAQAFHISLPMNGPARLTGRIATTEQRYSLKDLAGYAGEEGASGRLTIESGSISIGRDEPLALQVRGRYGTTPIGLTGNAGTLDALTAAARPWPLELTATAGGASLHVSGNIANPAKGEGLDLLIRLKGGQLAELAPLLGHPLPTLGSYELSSRLRDKAGGYIVDQLRGHLGSTGQPTRVLLTKGYVTIVSDKPVSVTIEGSYRQSPLVVAFNGGTLAHLRAPAGPWPVTLLVRGGGATLRVEGSVAKPAEGSGIDLRVKLDGQQLNQLAPLLGTALPAIQRYRLSAHLVETPQRGYAIRDLKSQIDRTDVAGMVAFERDDPRPRLVAQLRSERIDLTEFSVPAKKESTTPARKEALKLPVSALAAIDADVDVNVKQITGGSAPVRDVLLKARLQHGQLTVAPVQVSLPGVTIRGTARVDARTQTPAVSLELATDGVDLTTALKAFGAVEAIAGTAGTVTLRASSQGLDASALLQRANIQVDAHALNVSYRLSQNEVLPIALSRLELRSGPGVSTKLALDGAVRKVPVKLDLTADTLPNLVSGTARSPISLAATAADASFRADGHVQWRGNADGVVKFTLSGTKLDRLGPLVNLALPAAGPYEIKGQLGIADKTYRLTDFQARLADHSAEGNLVVAMGGKRSRINAKLVADTLPLDQLIKLGRSQEKTQSTPKPAGHANDRVIPDTPVPVAALRKLDLDLDISTRQASSTSIGTGGFLLKAKLTDGHLTVAPLKAKLSGGDLVVNFDLDVRGDTPAAKLDLTALQVDYGTLLKDLAATDIAQGVVDINIELSGQGSTLRDLLAQTNGIITLVSGPATIAGGQTNLIISGLITGVLSQMLKPEDSKHLNCMVGPFAVKDGIVQTNGILMDLPKFTIRGKGTINLHDEGLNMVFKPAPKKFTLISLAEPVGVKGTLASPQIDKLRTGVGVLLKFVVPILLIDVGTGEVNPCVAALAKAGDNKKSGDLAGESRGFLRKLMHPIETVEDVGAGTGGQAEQSKPR